jgi:transcriptional regulator with XRE-family HTH domain
MATETLSRFLRLARERHSLSLRSVEEQTGVSNAYLSQLEHGRIRQPSPVILHKLSELYGISYADVMRLAGYPFPGSRERDEKPQALARFGDVTPDEERALMEYLEFLRTRRGQRSSR